MNVRLKPSRRLVLVLAAAHSVAALLLWPLDMPSWLKVLGTLALAASLAYYVLHYAWLRMPGSVVALEVKHDGMGFRTRDGEWEACRPLPSSYVSSYFTILNLRAGDSRFARHVVILPDSLDAEDYRLLRVLLRWKAPDWMA